MKIALIGLLLISVLGFGQSSLHVKCYENLTFNFQNSVSLDSNPVEYALCGNTPSFYVSIFDTNCIAWQTIYLGGNGHFLGNYNTEGVCKQRAEYYFVYQQNNQQQLESLDSLINFWIPNNYAFVIYTPLSFNFSAINSIQPSLGQTLIDNWGNDVVNAQMMVLFGVKGFVNSYDIDTTIISGLIDYTNTICPNYEQTLGNIIDETLNPFEIYPNPSSNEIKIKNNGSKSINQIIIFNSFGEEIFNENVKFDIENIYQLSINKFSSGTFTMKFVSFDGELIGFQKLILK